ncbi:aminopeptidase [Paenibacillus daejeonensis]|uniref:aminopeptidase n=1 Tax=Paenibacillus daejeonensis TaxID=135193 RepID=UPI000371F5EF
MELLPTDKQIMDYAELIAMIGVNVQPGQTVVVMAPIGAARLARQIAVAAYEAGAHNVHVEYNDEELSLVKYKHAPEESLSEYPMWRANAWEEYAENGAAFVTIYAPNPDLLTGDIDPRRVGETIKAASQALQKYRSKLMNHANSWTLISYATPEWAAKVYPDLPVQEAEQQLWQRIIEATRLDAGNPVAAWKKHNRRLKDRVDLLNAKRYKQLRYQGEGTDLTIDLPEGHIWLGGAKANAKGDDFNPNMPTEEVFTMPHRDKVNGTVRSTKPLNYNGQLINNFALTFKDGKVVDFQAEQGYEILAQLIAADEGASRIGEVALVPDDSPISNSGVVFFNTLFDENASCHLALGQAYPVNLEGGTTMGPEELDAAGANRSLIHVDFMIGSASLSIDGILPDGSSEPIFRNGNWAEA